MVSARHYWTVEQLEQDIKDNEAEAKELRLRIRSELNPSKSLYFDLNAANMRSLASKEILDKIK